MPLAYLYDGSWDGLLSAVFCAFETRQWPALVAPAENAQLAFGQHPVHIPSEGGKARRVERGIVRHIGAPALDKVWTAFLSGDPDKSMAIYRYICTGIEKGRSIYRDLAHDDVLAIDNLYRRTTHEAHKLQGFTRFSLMENGVYFGRITPCNSVLPLIMPFFADRFSDQPLLLFDATHSLAGVYDLKEWYLVETAGLNLPPLAAEELPCRKLWRLFYHAISIAERENPRLRRSNMPKRYWGNMTEMR